MLKKPSQGWCPAGVFLSLNGYFVVWKGYNLLRKKNAVCRIKKPYDLILFGGRKQLFDHCVTGGGQNEDFKLPAIKDISQNLSDLSDHCNGIFLPDYLQLLQQCADSRNAGVLPANEQGLPAGGRGDGQCYGDDR